MFSIQLNWKANRSLYFLLFIAVCYGLAIGLSNTFVNVYIWRQTETMSVLVYYNLVLNACATIAFIFGGYATKRWTTGLVLRIGIALYIVFYLLVWLYAKPVPTFYYLIGALFGVATACYWLAFNVLTFEITEPDTRDWFNSIQGLGSSITGIIAPLVSGLIISSFPGVGGYSLVFMIAFGLFIIAIVLSFFLPIRPSENKPYRLRSVISALLKNENVKRVGFAHLSQGLREGSFFFLVTLMLYIVTKNEFKVGMFSFLSSIVSLFVYWRVRKHAEHETRRLRMLIGGGMLYASIALLYVGEYWSLLCYAVAIAVSYPLFLVAFHSMTYDVIGNLPNIRETRVEVFVFRELFLNSGRTISIVIFVFLLLSLGEKTAVSVCMLLLGGGHLGAALLMRGITKNRTL
ncbi:MAG: MFS transporter [Bacilli bacterium]